MWACVCTFCVVPIQMDIILAQYCGGLKENSLRLVALCSLIVQ